LKTKKAISYSNWIKVHDMVLKKEHLTEQGIFEIRAIKKVINPKNSITHRIGDK